MKRSIHHVVLLGAFLAVSQWSGVCADEQPAAKPMSRKDQVLLTITASVEDINYTNREVTLKGPLGNEVTLTVDQRVKRFKEIKVGDLVTADYYISFAADLRKPTPEEEKNPIVVLDAAGKAPPGTMPAAGGLRRIKVVTTIEGLDRPTETITVKGPLGHYFTARVADPENLTKMRIGENIVVVLTEALAISIEKADKKMDKKSSD